jgi:regulator of sigma E protease
MPILTNALTGVFDAAGPFLILLGLLITVHEFGHFIVAKLMGVRVEVFSLGFGKKILSYKYGDTNYCVSIIPLGGYVKMYGDDPTKEVPESERKYSFLKKPVGQRIAIVLAGPLMNLIFAFFLFMVIGVFGEPLPVAQIGDIAAGTRAFEAGFRSGDRILTIDEKPVQTWIEAKALINDSANKQLHFEVERANSIEKAQVQVTPILAPNDNIVSPRSEVGAIEGLDSLSAASMIGISDPDGVAAKAGLRSLDVITKVNDREVTTWRDLEHHLIEDLFKGRKPIHLTVESYADSDRPTPREIVLNTHDGEVKADLPKGHQSTGENVSQAMSLNDLGIESSQLYLWKVKSGSPAALAGLQLGDRILAVNDEPMESWLQVIKAVKTFNPDKAPLEFTYRRNKEIHKVSIRPAMTALIDTRGKDEQRFTIGIVSGQMQSGPRLMDFRTKGVTETLKMSTRRTIETTQMVIMSLVRLVQGDVSAKNIGGIISIGRFANQSYDAGFAAFMRMMALISINLFLLNLLPVPVLDGGHLVFFTIEALQGAPLSMRKMEIAQQVGLVILMFLMGFALFNDISNWLNSVW